MRFDEAPRMRVRLTFTEEVLGTASANPEIHREFIASKAPDAMKLEEEVAAIGVDAVDEKSTTVFPRDPEGHPCVYDYQIKGMFKDSCGMLKRVKGSESSHLKAYKKEIDGLVFIAERTIPFMLDGIPVDVHQHGGVGRCERPLRAQTAQGERVALASSETVPAGCTLEFTVIALREELLDYVEEWLDYGRMRGFGQWRNASKGRYTWEIIAEE